MKSLTELINEASISQKKRAIQDFINAFRKGKPGSNAVKSLVVFTAENPDSQEQTRQFNKKARGSLLDDIKQGKYAYVPAKGKFGNNEYPYAVFNMAVDIAKALAGKYQQTSFIYSKFADGKVYSEYWEKADITQPYSEKNGYVLKDTCDRWEDKSGAEDNFTVVGKKFKYSIPFSIFESVSTLIYKNAIKHVNEERERNAATTLTEDKFINMAVDCVGYSAYRWRAILTEGFTLDF